MNAMILAAGLGTRLRPFTKITPKPLFTISQRTLIDIIIKNLSLAGFEAVIVNTHHLHKQIESHIASQNYQIPVQTCHEVEILGTGGAIRNVAGFMDKEPFLIINSDLFTDINLKTVYDFHRSHSHPVTLVLYDDPEFNTVSVTHKGFVTAFDPSVPQMSGLKPSKNLTFTGIQVIDPEVLSFIPNTRVSSIIEAYQNLLQEGHQIRAYVPENCIWRDIGTPDRYRETVFDQMAPKAFASAWPDIRKRTDTFKVIPLAGDGSNRKWFRLTSKDGSLILADHGIKDQKNRSEVEAFIHINAHLARIPVPVPRIFAADTVSGLVFMQDLGDTHLQDRIQETHHPETVLFYYKSIVDHLVKMNTTGVQAFDPTWAYQSTTYSKDVILEKECRYFVESFVIDFLNQPVSYEAFETEFVKIADGALNHAVTGLMHRDFQSRNIMITDGKVYFIDFQGARIGPIQYDLASLLIDPYVTLSPEIQNRIYTHCLTTLSDLTPVDPVSFSRGYWFCAVARNLQILGAFAHLSQHSNKPWFAEYIPKGIQNLKQLFKQTPGIDQFPELRALVAEISDKPVPIYNRRSRRQK